jgi:diaminopimelate epimerase
LFARLGKTHCPSVEGITLQMCGNAFRAFEHLADVVRTTEGTQVEVSEMKKSGGKLL